jgi:hypothetical protein
VNIPVGRGLPTPLRLAALIAVAQGLALLGYAVLEVAALRSGRVTMGITTAAFFTAYAAMLLVCARGLLLARSWARGPVMFAQLVWLGVAWSFRGGGTTWVAILLAVAAVVTIAGVLAPASIAALAHEEDSRETGRRGP